MKLPKEKYEKRAQEKQQVPKWLIPLCVFTLLLSIASAGLCALVLSDMPSKIDSYVQAHKQELKGDKGDTGPMGPRGFTGASGLNGTNSYAPTHCYSSDLFGGVTTNCY